MKQTVQHSPKVGQRGDLPAARSAAKPLVPVSDDFGCLHVGGSDDQGASRDSDSPHCPTGRW